LEDTPHPNEEYKRFEVEVTEAQKKGEKSIGQALAKRSL
jgi:hypothetical protein